MDQSYGADYDAVYHRHWWWRSRQRILIRVIQSLDLGKSPAILDFGCGNGLFLSCLNEFGDVRGLEVDSSLLDDQNRFRDRIFTEPLESPSYADWKFDLITACDVIEHIEHDKTAIHKLVSMLNPGGYLLITVPAFRLLWDHHDEINHHFRRYRRREILNLLADQLILDRCRYCFHSIFLPKLLVKLWNIRRGEKVAQHGIPHPAINRIMQALCCIEFDLTASYSPPFGTSILAVGRKRFEAVHGGMSRPRAEVAGQSS